LESIESIALLIAAGLGIALELLGWAFYSVCQAMAGILYDTKSRAMRRCQKGAAVFLLGGGVLVVAGVCLLRFGVAGWALLACGLIALFIAGYLGHIAEKMLSGDSDIGAPPETTSRFH
jgi:hypothetical protein